MTHWGWGDTEPHPPLSTQGQSPDGGGAVLLMEPWPPAPEVLHRVLPGRVVHALLLRPPAPGGALSALSIATQQHQEK